jgi:hypothetical protein
MPTVNDQRRSAITPVGACVGVLSCLASIDMERNAKEHSSPVCRVEDTHQLVRSVWQAAQLERCMETDLDTLAAERLPMPRTLPLPRTIAPVLAMEMSGR